MSTQVVHNSGNNEWYTPQEYVALARQVMGAIDLDPASCAAANEVVQATRYYTVEEDGLSLPWTGRVWMNPPYGTRLIRKFVDKLIAHVQAGDVPQAIVLVNNASETEWFQTLGDYAERVCFPRRRIQFWHPEQPLRSPMQGQAVFYYGDRARLFALTFASVGMIWQ
jgi:ParB family chromosome partitioning protein